jgi:hypothetical protein
MTAWEHTIMSLYPSLLLLYWMYTTPRCTPVLHRVLDGAAA